MSFEEMFPDVPDRLPDTYELTPAGYPIARSLQISGLSLSIQNWVWSMFSNPTYKHSGNPGWYDYQKMVRQCAIELGCAEKTVRNVITHMEECGIVERQKINPHVKKSLARFYYIRPLEIKNAI